MMLVIIFKLIFLLYKSGVGNLFSRRAALITKELAKGQCSCKCPKKGPTFLHCRIIERRHDGLQKKKKRLSPSEWTEKASVQTDKCLFHCGM